MKKKKILVSTIIFLIIILLFPIPLKLKDGGSIEFKSILYNVTKYKQISNDGFTKGWKIDILGITIYDKKIPPK